MIEIDRFRSFVFPNRVRELRQTRGCATLLALADAVPQIPYIRLSKIERGAVFARVEELGQIAQALDVAPCDLLIDVDDAAFSIEGWAKPFSDESEEDDDEQQRFAVALGAAVRAHRDEKDVSVTMVESSYGLPQVMLSRIENAHRPFHRLNDATRAAVCRIFGVNGEESLRRHVDDRLASGALQAHLGAISTPAMRHERTSRRIATLRAELGGDSEADRAPQQSDTNDPSAAGPDEPRRGPLPRRVPVYGAALPGGLIAAVPTGESVEAPALAGPAAFGLRIYRPTLGGGLPAQAVLIVDPDRFPAPGGIAAIREAEGYRVLAVTFDRQGAMTGYSVSPEMEVSLDSLDPRTVAAVVAAVFV